MYLVGFDQFPARHRVDAGHLGSQWLGAVGDAQGFGIRVRAMVRTWDILGYRILRVESSW
jgi:hypothetical protein